MQWDPETMDWALWLPFMSLLAGRAWPWLLRMPGPRQVASRTVGASRVGRPPLYKTGKLAPCGPTVGNGLRALSVAVPPARGWELPVGGGRREPRAGQQ